MSEKVQESLINLASLIVAFLIAAILIYGLYYFGNVRPGRQCVERSEALGLSTRWDSGICLAEVYGVWTPENQLKYLVADLLEDTP